MDCKLSVVVPCFNEEEALPLFYEELTRVMKELGCTYEIYLIDDGSKDGTLSIMRSLAKADGHVQYVSFSRNFGKEAAMYAGLQASHGDYVCVADADMQDPPALIPQMLSDLESGEWDCVASRRKTRAGEPPIRSFFARRFYGLINSISSTHIVEAARDFRLMKREMVDAILSMSEYNRFSKGLFGWVGFRTKWLEYDNIERVAGTTKWSFWKLFKYALEGIMAFSIVPLVLALFISGALIIAALIMFICCLALPGAPAWLPLGTLIVFMTGINAGLIGILSLYFSRTYLETKNRPIYIAAERSDRKDRQ